MPSSVKNSFNIVYGRQCVSPRGLPCLSRLYGKYGINTAPYSILIFPVIPDILYPSSDNPRMVGRMLLPMSEYSMIPDILYPSWDNLRMRWTYGTPCVGVFGDS